MGPREDYYHPPPDRKYFNNDEHYSHEEDEDDYFEDIIPEHVPSKRQHLDYDQQNLDPFSPNYFRSSPDNFQPNRGRMFSAESDISAIDLDIDTEKVFEETDCVKKDPMSISDFPDDFPSEKKSKYDTDNFDMS